MKAIRFKETKNQCMGGRIINVGLSLKRSTGDKQEGKIVSDTDVHKESGNMSQSYESGEGGEILN